MSMDQIEHAAVQQDILLGARVTKLAKKAGAYKRLVAKSLKQLKTTEKQKLATVNAEAREGVWTSYQATLQRRAAHAEADAKNVDIAMQEEADFRARVRDRVSSLARTADRVKRLETAQQKIATRLSHVHTAVPHRERESKELGESSGIGGAVIESITVYSPTGDKS